MGLNTDDEILQEFLVEASEIHERLGEQLVDLENSPDDNALLNAVFRGFHTIKGGAGFLNLTAMVILCHRAEDVFNILRQGQRRIDPPLMDVVLQVIDNVGAMLEDMRHGKEPFLAAPALIHALEGYAVPANAAPSPPPSPPPSPQPLSPVVGAASTPAGDADTITEEEFEALLDQLHGPVVHASVPQLAPAALGADVPMPNIATKAAAEDESPAACQPAVAGGSKEQVDTTVRVDTKRLDDIMNLVGELVLVRNRLIVLKSTLSSDNQIAQVVSNLDLVTSDLQTAVMKTRMQPIKKAFGRFPRVVRDLARNLNKEVNLELVGEDTGLDKNLVEALADPLVHLVRNAVDHGIERPEVREAAGKPRAGTVVLAAKQEGDHILLSIKDDGAGMDADVLRRKAVEKGLFDAEAAARLDKNECYNLILAAGFSTKSEISDVSGRGVGMDVVKTRISQLNGTIEINSEVGRGSEIVIKLPLTLAIVPTLMVMLNNQIFALPLANISEIFDISDTRVNTVDGRFVTVVRDKTLPLIFLRDWLVRGASRGKRVEGGFVVIVRIGTQTVGCVVDQLLGQEEVVIKPLGALLHGLQGLAGATITGNGRIALILDLPGLMVRNIHGT